MKLAKQHTFRKIVSLGIIVMLLSLIGVLLVTEEVKAEYTDESTTLGSYIAWITLYDNDGAVIINWTSANDDVVPNVNVQDKGVGYWSMGIYVNEADGGYSSNPANAISIYLQFKNMTDDLAWYPNPSNYGSYLSSYTDYGAYTIVNYKTPDWATQMTYDWWNLDSELTVNATLYLNSGATGVVQETNVTAVVSSDASFPNVYTSYDAVYAGISQGNVYCRYMGSTYQVWRQYFWFNNPSSDLEVIFDFTSMVGSYNQIYAMVYDDPVTNDDWTADYWSLDNWSQTTAVFYPDGTTTPGASFNTTSDTLYFNIPESTDYGDYIFVMLISSADWQHLIPNDTTSNLGGSSGSVYGITIPNNFTLAYSFEQQIINHEAFSLDTRSIVWLLIGLLPSAILGYFIGRPGVAVGLAIMGFVIGLTQANYFWVMGLTLGVSGIMIYKGGIR